MTQWDFQNKGKSGWTGKSSFALEVPLLLGSIAFSKKSANNAEYYKAIFALKAIFPTLINKSM